MHFKEKYRVFEIVTDDDIDFNSEAVMAAFDIIKPIDGVTLSWVVPGKLEVRFEEHVGVYDVVDDIMIELRKLGYR